MSTPEASPKTLRILVLPLHLQKKTFLKKKTIRSNEEMKNYIDLLSQRLPEIPETIPETTSPLSPQNSTSQKYRYNKSMSISSKRNPTILDKISIALIW